MSKVIDPLTDEQWPQPITVKVADVTDAEQFPNIAEAVANAKEKGDE